MSDDSFENIRNHSRPSHCCRCNNVSQACYHVGSCSLCAYHSGINQAFPYVGDPLTLPPQTVPMPSVPIQAPFEYGPSFPSVQLIREDLELLKEILQTLKEIKALLEKA